MAIRLPPAVEAGRVRNPLRGCGWFVSDPARARLLLPTASLRPASRVTVHATGPTALQTGIAPDPPVACPVLPLRDGLRFAHFPALGRSPCSLFNRREQGELYAGGAASLQERSLSTRMVLLATTLLPIPAISIAEFPFHPAVEQGGRETVRRGDNAADRRPAELLARCSAELSPHPRMRIPYSPAPPVRGCSDTNAVSGGGTPPESAASEYSAAALLPTSVSLVLHFRWIHRVRAVFPGVVDRVPRRARTPRQAASER